MSRRIATAGFVVLMVMTGTEVVRAQAALGTVGPSSVAAPPVDPCRGLLCGLNPAAMDRPILAEDAKRMEAERAGLTADAPPPRDAKQDRHRRVAHARHGIQAHGHVAAVKTQTLGRRHMGTTALVASRPADPAAGAPINAIFVLAPRPFDPYGGDYAPWLDRLSWPSHFDRADDHTVFAPDGYREVDGALSQPARTQASGELARRTNALSQRGFQSLAGFSH